MKWDARMIVLVLSLVGIALMDLQLKVTRALLSVATYEKFKVKHVMTITF